MGKKKEIKIVKPFLLPPRPDVCQQCATDHEPNFPHNAHSLYYQTKFQMDHGRGATWVDAMGHCTDDMKKIWKELLLSKKINIDAGEIYPKKEGSAK